MKKFLTSVMLLAVLTALILTGCGDNANQVSSAEGLEPFGNVEVIPSAVPSTGTMTPSSTPQIAAPNTSNKPGNVVEGNTQASTAPASPSPTTVVVPEPSYFVAPSIAPSSAPTPTPSQEPLPDDPAAPTTASPDEVLPYVGQPLSKLIDELGYPTSSDYEPVDEENDTVEANGTLYFAGGYTVTTYRAPDGTETITSVNVG